MKERLTMLLACLFLTVGMMDSLSLAPQSSLWERRLVP